MAGWKIKYRKLRINKLYTKKELASIFNVSAKAIDYRIKKGLKPMNPGGKPLYFDGERTKKYFKNEKEKKKIIVKPFEMLCLKCRASRKPKIDTIEIKETNIVIGNKGLLKVYIYGKCNKCGCNLVRFSSSEKVKSFLDFYQLSKESDEYKKEK